jgi:hypothetical protein
MHWGLIEDTVNGIFNSEMFDEEEFRTTAEVIASTAISQL